MSDRPIKRTLREALQQRVEQQAAQNETLRQRIERLSGQVTCLDAELQDARRDVAHALELMRQPGR